MAYFAQLDENNIVTQVIVVNDDDAPDENVGIAFCQSHAGDDTNWKQTSMGGFRGNFACVGHTYMTNVATMGVGSTDIFISPQPYASWSISTIEAEWLSPLGAAPGLTTEQGMAGYIYAWDEEAYQADNTVGWALTTHM